MTTPCTAPHVTPEHRKAQAEALHASITEQVDALRHSDQWRAFLDFAQSFHPYSLNNLLLIHAQYPTATAVAGFRQWQTKGRQVRTGEKAIRIFGYSSRTIIEQDDTGTETEHRIPRYPILSVFDLAQTDPIPGTDDHTSPAQRLTGHDDHGITDTLTRYLTSQGWTVSREPIPGDANGYVDPATRRVVIDAALSPTHAAKTTIHETAHILLGHTDENPRTYLEHRGLKEIEAESVAYIVAGLTGIDTSTYSIGYITSWTDDTTTIKTTAEHVLRTAHHITEIHSPTQHHSA
jgi:antirestriction protein ArdC